MNLPISQSRFSPNTNDDSVISEEEASQRIVEIHRKYQAIDAKTHLGSEEEADEEHSFAARSMTKMCYSRRYEMGKTSSWGSRRGGKVAEVPEVTWLRTQGHEFQTLAHYLFPSLASYVTLDKLQQLS